jgi:hypothetical protein
LFPIAAFLRAGGVTKKAASHRLGAAFDSARKLAKARRIEHIGHPMLYADIVALWAHDLRFVDETGRPRSLALEGRNEFIALVRTVDREADAREVLGVLTRFGNVRRARNGKYRLVRPLFFTSTSKTMAFEPMAYFLSDASATLGRILKRTNRSRGPEVFWRKVESAGLSPVDARRFVAFVRERGQEFLEELDDWLEARAVRQNTKTRRGLRRVGIGMFSIDSSAELTRPRA